MIDDMRINWKDNVATVDITHHIQRLAKWIAEQEDKVLLDALKSRGIRLCDHNCVLKQIYELTLRHFDDIGKHECGLSFCFISEIMGLSNIE